MDKMKIWLFVWLPICFAAKTVTHGHPGYYFPPPGESLCEQDQRSPDEVGLSEEIVKQLNALPFTNGSRWALWRHGYLVYVQGDFNQTLEVKSHRKTWHALTVGAALHQGKIPSYHQKLSTWNKQLKGKDAQATWCHVMTQTSGFDYPYADSPAYRPGEMWTYSDKNPKQLCDALAHIYGRCDINDHYDQVVRLAYFEATVTASSSPVLASSHIRRHTAYRILSTLK